MLSALSKAVRSRDDVDAVARLNADESRRRSILTLGQRPTRVTDAEREFPVGGIDCTGKSFGYGKQTEEIRFLVCAGASSR